MCERSISRLPLTHLQMGPWPATQACALAGNRTSKLLVCRLGLNPLSHTSQGVSAVLFCFFKILFICREREKRKKEKERISIFSCLSRAPNWGPGPNPGMCPDWESNPWPFGSQAGAIYRAYTVLSTHSPLVLFRSYPTCLLCLSLPASLWTC